MTEKKYTEVKESFWNPENDGDSVEGEYIREKSNVGKNKSIVYVLKNPGNITLVWDTTILSEKMSMISIGEKIRITYLGIKKAEKGGQDYKDYRLDLVEGGED